MRPFIVDLNDTAVRIARGSDELANSPGYATLVGGRLEVGDSGYAHAWLQPRQSSNRFWHDLNTASVTQFGKRIRHHGDLAYLHLQSLKERAGRPTQAVFAVPGAMPRPQLSLLLGIAQATGIEVSALVDSAVAAGAMLAPGLYKIAELQLHQTVLTTVEINTTQIERRQVDVIAGAGLVHFEATFIGVIEALFLARCRFDPLHDAVTEQLLHSHLPAWLRLLREQPEIQLTIDYQGAHHACGITSVALAGAAQKLYQTIRQHVGGETLVLDHRLGALPGAIETLRPSQQLDADAVFAGCNASAELNEATAVAGVNLRTTLQRAADAPTAIATGAPKITTATHLLAQHTAHPLGNQPLYLTRQGQMQRQHSDDAVGCAIHTAQGVRLDVLNHASVTVNGRVVTGQVLLASGDHITIPGASAVFIPIEVATAHAI